MINAPSRSLRKLGLCALLSLGCLVPLGEVQANSGAGAAAGQALHKNKRHVFEDANSSATMVVTAGFSMKVQLYYDGETVYDNTLIGNARSQIHRSTMSVDCPYNARVMVRIEVFHQGAPFHSYSWSEALPVQANGQSVGFEYRSPAHPSERGTPAMARMYFKYEPRTEATANEIRVLID